MLNKTLTNLIAMTLYAKDFFYAIAVWETIFFKHSEISTRQNEIVLAIWRVTFFFKLANNLQQIPNKQYSNVQQFILQILTSHYLSQEGSTLSLRAALISSSSISLSSSFKF